jgi:rRNA maturation RNase YbeY
MIQYLAENVALPKIDEHRINRWIKQVASGYEKKTGQIVYVFCDDEKILETNKKFLEHDYYTDIITFDYSRGSTISGDIFISLDTVKSNAEEQNLTFEQELLRIIIHGILHLCGNNDKTPEERADMTMKENEALSML